MINENYYILGLDRLNELISSIMKSKFNISEFTNFIRLLIIKVYYNFNEMPVDIFQEIFKRTILLLSIYKKMGFEYNCLERTENLLYELLINLDI